MNEVRINILDIRKVIISQYAISSELNAQLEKIENICNDLKWEFAQKQIIESNLIKLAEQIRGDTNAATDFANKLNQIVEIYEKTEGVITGKTDNEKGEAIKDLAGDYDHTTTVYDDNDGNGTYGADQGNMKYHKKGIGIWKFRIFEDEELFAFIRGYDRYKNYSQNEIAKLLDQINAEGCGYVAIVNNIFVEFEGREKEFEERFGFPMYDDRGRANYDYLIVDFYASTDDSYYLNDPMGATALANDIIKDYADNGKEAEFYEKYGCAPLLDDKHLNPLAKQKVLDEYLNQDVVEYKKDNGVTAYGLENRFRHYLDGKGIKNDCTVIKEDMNIDEVQNCLDNECNVNIRTAEFNLYNEKGRAVHKDVGSHWMTITGVTDDGRYIVSSWGRRYYLEPSELLEKDFLVTNIS